MSSNYFATIIDHIDPSTIYMVSVLGARNEDEAKIKAFAWFFKCPEDEIELDLGGIADYTIEVTTEDNMPTVC